MQAFGQTVTIQSFPLCLRKISDVQAQLLLKTKMIEGFPPLTVNHCRRPKAHQVYRGERVMRLCIDWSQHQMVRPRLQLNIAKKTLMMGHRRRYHHDLQACVSFAREVSCEDNQGQSFKPLLPLLFPLLISILKVTRTAIEKIMLHPPSQHHPQNLSGHTGAFENSIGEMVAKTMILLV